MKEWELTKGAGPNSFEAMRSAENPFMEDFAFIFRNSMKNGGGASPAAGKASSSGSSTAAKKRKADEKTKIKISGKKEGRKRTKKDEDSDGYDSDGDVEPTKHEDNLEDLAKANLPPDAIMYRLLDRVEAQLPKDDHVKYDSRVRKLDWNKIAWDELPPAECQRVWGYIQDRIRRYRIMVSQY